MTSSRNLSVDLVKIVAMLGVMALHTALGKVGKLPTFCLTNIAGLSIPLFFMVSGYLMQGRRADWHYALKKIFGILRFTFIVCMAFGLVQCLFNEFSLVYLAKVWLGGFVQKGRFFTVFWYFGAMMIVYALLPLYNRLEQRSPRFLPNLILFLLVVEFYVFMANYIYGFEQTYVIQTFRVWNWLLFFSIGQLLKKVQLGRKVGLGHVLVVMLSFLVFVYVVDPHVGGIEYFFGSLPLQVYATLSFVWLLSRKIHHSSIVSSLSRLFLPVYALHMFVIDWVNGLAFTGGLGMFAAWGDYVIVVTLTLLLSWAVMKIPYMDRVFRI